MNLKKKLAACLLALPLTLSAACGNNGNNGGTGGGTTQPIDLAVGDKLHYTGISATDSGLIYLWFNVLANLGPALPAPDVTLDAGDRTPIDMEFYNGDLYVGCTNTNSTEGGLLIYRDYLNATDGDTADVSVFDAADPLVGPLGIQELALENNVLVAVSFYNPNEGVYIWDNASDITDGQAADVFIDDTTLGLPAGSFDDQTDVALVNGRLFVSNWSGTDDYVAVAIWNDVQDILAGGDSTAPDVVLTDNDNFLDLGNGGRALEVDNDTLYVADGDQVNVYVFFNASELTNASLPDVILEGCTDYNEGCYINSVTDIEVINNTLWVSNKNYNTADFHDPGVVGFTPANALSANQPPTVLLTGDVLLPSAERMATAGGALFITGTPDPDYNNNSFASGIFIYRDASRIATGTAADLSAIGSDDYTGTVSFMESPIAIAATVSGSFDNFFDAGT